MKDARQYPRAIIPTGEIEAEPNNPFSIPVPKCYDVVLGKNEYLGHQSSTIFQILSQHKRNILYSGAGTGKNTLMIKLAKSGLVQRLGCERLVIVVMVTTVGQQSQKDFAEKGIIASFVAGAGVGDQYEKGVTDYELGTADVIICVADSLHKISGLIGNSFYVQDEMDAVVRDASKLFRSLAMEKAFNHSLIAKHVLQMSATPNLIFTTNLHEGFNYNLIHCVDHAPNKKILSFVECSDKISQFDKLEYLENFNPDELEEGTIIVKNDNDIFNEAARKQYQKRGAIVDYFTSKRPERKERNANYQNLVSTGYFDKNLDIVLTTKLLDTGVSIKNPISLVGSFDSRSWQEIVQLSARPRHNVATGANMKNRIIIFVPKQKNTWRATGKTRRNYRILHTSGKLENSLKEWKILISAYCNNRRPTELREWSDTRKQRIDKTRVEQRFCKLLSEVKKYCKAVNSFGGGGDSTHTSGDLKYLTTEDMRGVHHISIPQILNELHRQETNETNLPLLIEKIKLADTRFAIDIRQFEKIELSPELVQLQATIKTTKDAQKQFRTDYIELLRNETEDTINAYLVLSKDMKRREALQETFQTGLLNKHVVSNFVAQYPVAVAYKDKGKIISYLAKLVNIGIEKDLVFDMLATEKQKNLKLFSDRKIVAWRHKQGFWNSPHDKMECDIDKAIVKGINKAKKNLGQGKYKYGIQKKHITNIIKERATKITDIFKNECKTPILTDTQCFSRLGTLFEFEPKQKKVNNKRITIYEIGKCKIELRGKKPEKKA